MDFSYLWADFVNVQGIKLYLSFADQQHFVVKKTSASMHLNFKEVTL